MLHEQSLLERVGMGIPARGPNRPLSLPQLLESVSVHLTTMLNSRQGTSASVFDYGLPVLSDLEGARESRGILVQRAIRNTIEKYEPRLCDVMVREITLEEGTFENPSVLRFEIEATIDGQHESERELVCFESQLEDERRWHCHAVGLG
jgi:type VI secretion system protein